MQKKEEMQFDRSLAEPSGQAYLYYTIIKGVIRDWDPVVIYNKAPNATDEKYEKVINVNATKQKNV